MDKRILDRTKFLIAVKKGINRAALCFSITALFISILFTVTGTYIEPVKLLKLWITFFILGILVFFRTLANTSKWAMGKPFILMNIIFMPLFLFVSLVFALDVSRTEDQILPDFSRLPVYAGIFLVCFIIVQIIGYFVTKAKTDRMNDALLEFRKEQKWDEEE